MHRLFIAVVTCSLAMSGAASALSKQDRDELFQRIDHMCRDASSVGEVITYDGSLDAGATLRVVGLNANGKVNKEQWKNIEQKYGEFKTNPTICNMEMLKLILPLFDHPANTMGTDDVPPKFPETAATRVSAFQFQTPPQEVKPGSKMEKGNARRMGAAIS
jgi:hypothetical protein